MSVAMDFLVFIPANAQTGGPEALHQLADCLETHTEHSVQVVYFNPQRPINFGIVNNKPVLFTDFFKTPDNYKIYSFKIASNPTLTKETICILPEMLPDVAASISKYCKVLFWWLSIDNFFFHGFATRISNFLDLINHNIYHATQSVYAATFLNNLGITSCSLSDYITYPVLEEINFSREDKVLFNPAKQSQLTQPFINALKPHVNLIPIQGYSHAELKNLFQTSKIYLELGHNPGKDRLPREAVANGCLLMCTDTGAGHYFRDTPIPVNSLISLQDLKTKQYEPLIKNITTNLKTYSSSWSDYSFYRETISKERQTFIEEVKNLSVFLNKP